MNSVNNKKQRFDVPDVTNRVPRVLKPWLFILFVIIIQLSGGVYLAATTHIVGDTALMQEDVMMAGYASLIGLSLNFTVMFRLKFRFSLRASLKTCCLVIILCNLVIITTDSFPVLVAASFLAGWFRMWATLMCNSTIQLWITPKRDMAVWLSYIYLLVEGAIQLTGLTTVYVEYFYGWEYMHWLMIGLLCVVFVAVCLLVHHHRSMPKLPLFGIDWFGSLLWAIFLFCLTFVCVYGDHYDWYDSDYIQGATLLGLVALVLNIWRMTFLRHPYMSPLVLTNRRVIKVTILYMVAYVLIAPEHVCEHAYAAEILGYDSLNLISLNWYVWAGVICGCGFLYIFFARLRWQYKTMTIIGFCLIGIYLAYFYFFIDYNLPKEMLGLPLFCRGAGLVIVSVAFLTSLLDAGLPFPFYGQCISVNGFCSAVIGCVLGPALIGELFQHIMAKNAMLIGAEMVATNVKASLLPMPQLYGIVQHQALIVSIKEVYGWLLMAAIVLIAMLLVVSSGTIRPSAIHPKWSTIRKQMKRSLRVYRHIRIPWLVEKQSEANM